uniref:Uncharacterized protein n=1 Tax=Anguilla anguilla TaxID=7936 RepID=A0A0E9VMU9_ANGAN
MWLKIVGDQGLKQQSSESPC